MQVQYIAEMQMHMQELFQHVTNAKCLYRDEHMPMKKYYCRANEYMQPTIYNCNSNSYANAKDWFWF